MTEDEQIDEILTRGVAEVIHPDALRAKLLSGRKLRIKFGVDPTSPNIHLGRATAIWKLRDLQDLGHTIVFIIGDFTGVIGDTSDKEAERPMLARETVEENLATYFEQAGEILDMEKVEKHRNTEWLELLTYREITEHAEVFSLSDFISRENIKVRLDKGLRVSLRELLYPLMQGYDSVAVNADVEIGGTDQKFNMLSGRKLQEHFKKEPQSILMLDLIEGLDGRKMSSSWGNTINLADTADDMFGKVMSLRDELIVKYFIHATRVPMSTVEEAEASLGRGKNPRDVKLQLAEEIVSMYHGKDEAVRAREAFISTFQKKEIPEDIEEIKGEGKLGELLKSKEIISSMTDWRRLVEEGAVKRLSGEEEKITDDTLFATPGVYKIGKRRFVRII
ncbi:MAG: tyrosine--tRNA ligase [Candidatus Yonathbacteria bacterium CG10_big_fil_rev_8_21_14_0_10_43_136]|uniref:Tyrosine--tRNA ligase n=1 Tax=Candidatus Yonathbacteria bacterium CG_4_10_14_0_8_um_filter_43_17 TaxID=1975099 RepID=A0A2M7Q5G2_9BACT|nr:MAG: tyrosine--tRNA ligase [Candidatus Yonathbacteria bacterium CG10_big_fil_rev_8_21_14_0_10_43_136]PIX57301.1 MAG: tyrosine--tRNA ligase [Candidatus Yonathbacteria bacterium CG_4_10_14_3_um_filter_43_12]PIY58668.1 MAG: tyrosine--tRNA ligase [Candidatus Yonathbacteria bacterium CG_4_10_14_0_8_um_filter_43_17]PJC21820.1 MAG: tyrosine--tRNA ligase [Candidatus Yonathbacteria bacterium CG_4_9_14_0_2_um_filter_43_16]